jgi:DNA polymerase/3'-5' exonuclease PolX
MGFKLNEYGVFNRTTGDYLGGKTEDEVYKLLNKTPKLPELRAEQYIFPNQQSGVGVGKVERKKKK